MSKTRQVQKTSKTPFEVIKDFFGYPNVRTEKEDLMKLNQAFIEIDEYSLSAEQVSYMQDLLQQLSVLLKARDIIIKARAHKNKQKRKRVVKMFSNLTAA